MIKNTAIDELADSYADAIGVSKSDSEVITDALAEAQALRLRCETAEAEAGRLREALIESNSVLKMVAYNSNIDPDLMKSVKWAEANTQAARAAVPALLDEVDSLRARVTELEASTATAEAEAGRLREALTAHKRHCYKHSNGDDSCHCADIDSALAASPAPETKQGEREAVAEACVKWISDEDNIIYIDDFDGQCYCEICQLDEENFSTWFDNKESVVHEPDCLHLRAKALRAQAPAGGRGDNGEAGGG